MMKAMILLGVNSGFGNGDCAAMTLDGLTLVGGWADLPRPKIGIARRCPPWPETVEAIQAAIAVRPKPADADASRQAFLTYRGTAWVHISKEKDNRSDYVSPGFNKYLKSLGLSKPGCGFRTIADGARDTPAVRAIMGHIDASIDSAYRERIGDERLRAVVEYVRMWLWPKKETKASV